MRKPYRFSRISTPVKPRVLGVSQKYTYTEFDQDAQTLFEIIRANDPFASMTTKDSSWSYVYWIDEDVIVAVTLTISSCNYILVDLD